jgi:hypothetical protein
MGTQYKATTQNDISRYKAICEALISKTEIETDYSALRILFVDNKSLLEVFQKEITQAIGGPFQGKLPAQAHAYVAKQNKAAIAINTDSLKDKIDEYCEFILLEEFCHLLDYAAADFAQSSQYLSFCTEYSRYVDWHFAQEIAENLGRFYDHYYVNKLMLSFDVEKWIEFRSDCYGENSRARLNRLFSGVSATRPAKHCLTIITTEILRILCVVRAVESFLMNAQLQETQIQQLTECKNSALETVRFAEQKAKAIDNTYPNTVDYFRRNDFVSKDSFFVRVRQFWTYLHLFGNNS